MDFNSYQETVHNLSEHKKEIGPFSMILAIIKDTGIISDKLRYILEDNDGSFNDEDKVRIAISLGDIINDVANMASDLGISLEEVIAINMKKMEMIVQSKGQENNQK